MSFRIISFYCGSSQFTFRIVNFIIDFKYYVTYVVYPIYRLRETSQVSSYNYLIFNLVVLMS